MTVTSELPPDLENELSVRAAEHGQAVPGYLISLVEADVYGELEMSELKREEEVLLVQERQQDRLSGDRGVLLEDYGQAFSQSVRRVLNRPSRRHERA